MKFSREKSKQGCSWGPDCYHHRFAEENAIRDCVAKFSKELLDKLYKKKSEGYTGWDNPEWTRENIIKALKDHIDKGDMIDIAAFAMFAWNRQDANS